MKIRGKAVRSAAAPRRRKFIQMNYPMMSRPSWAAQPPTFIREAVHRRMLQAAYDIGGLIDFEPHHRFVGTEGSILLRESGLLIMATSQFRPLGWDRAEDISGRHGLDVLLLRFNAYQVTVDICMCSRNAWLSRYHRWSVAEELWFIPGEDNGSPYVKVGQSGLSLTDHPPYANARQRQGGFSWVYPQPVQQEPSA